MKLKDFVKRHSALDDKAFLQRFGHPFLLESTDFLEEEDERRVFSVRGKTVGGPVLVGRGSSCDVVINDPLVSTYHAELVPPLSPGKPWQIVDQGSTHKTRVGAEEIAPSTAVGVPDGTKLAFGPGSHYMFLHAGSFLREFNAAVGESQGGGPAETIEHGKPGRNAELFIYCEPLDPVELEMGEPVIVGRDKEVADLVIRDKMASREHCEIERRAWGVFVRDCGSANGTFLGSTRLGDDWTFLAVGQVLTIGTTQLYVQRPQPTASSVHTRKMTREMLTRVTKAKKRGIQGDLRETPLAELLQQIEERKDTGTLDINGATVSGRLTFFEGHPCEASASDGSDQLNAILALLKEKRGSYTLELLSDSKMGRTFSEILLEEFLSEI